MRSEFAMFALGSVAVVAAVGYFWPVFYWVYIILGPLVLVGLYDMFQPHHAIRRNFPLVGRLRYLLESIRPALRQYFFESDTDGKPFNRLQRDLIYARAKKQRDTKPFGTQLNVYSEGYEWTSHSIYALDAEAIPHDQRLCIGGPMCKKPYSASLLNISAMSFGSLSGRAVEAMNLGARLGHFYQNTGEGGLTDYHLKYGGDLVWQIGTGYFGCRDESGRFDPQQFGRKAVIPQIKMIEIKLSQGAKPGHGGILPALKNTGEIAAIRGLKPHTQVISPPYHTAFKDASGLLEFVELLRDLSGGKPVGFKLCIGSQEEFTSICEAMIQTDITPDFIAVDGGEGGTGAAPPEFSDSVGFPLREGLAFASDTLTGYGLRERIKLIASGKIATGFHLFRALALGADLCNSARAMMMAAGCIQTLECNENTCPVGVATQDKELEKGLVVRDKSARVKVFHTETLRSFVELMAGCGLAHPKDIERKHVFRRVSMDEVKRYDVLFPSLRKRVLLELDAPDYPMRYKGIQPIRAEN